jgi:hypothetical protein
MSTTPRTDARELAISIQNEDSCCAIYVKIDGKEYEGGLVDSDFARELECENARMRETLNSALEAAELDYKSALLDYEEAQEQCVSCFHEHNAASYRKGIRDALRNLLGAIDAAMEGEK